MLVKRVDHRKSGFPLMEPSMNRFAAHVEQKIVHPSHVPFQPEPETAEVGWPGNTRPGGGFFCDSHDSGKPLVTDFVKAFHEIDGVQVFTTAVDIGYPFPLFPRVV